MFGTFSPESDKVYYGLVHPVRTFNPITLQVRIVTNSYYPCNWNNN